ncbi:hypothetical protein [Polymorphospora sp. NPDC050346]|uniref:hypothetical protein n=1 Tax=Polymorphospora sp. NPDC050346 TaxID=3155780 RepID=UPI0033CB1EF2
MCHRPRPAPGDAAGEAKVVLIREPVPRDISTEWASLSQGVRGPDLPPWGGRLIVRELTAAWRDVPVSSGPGLLDIMVMPSAPTGLDGWADQMITPQ